MGSTWWDRVILSNELLAGLPLMQYEERKKHKKNLGCSWDLNLGLYDFQPDAHPTRSLCGEVED